MPSSSPASWAARNGGSVKTPPKSKRTASIGPAEEPSVVNMSRWSRVPIVGAAVRFQLLGQCPAVGVDQQAVRAGAPRWAPPHRGGGLPPAGLQGSLEHLVGAGERHRLGDTHEPGRPLGAEVRLRVEKLLEGV